MVHADPPWASKSAFGRPKFRTDRLTDRSKLRCSAIILFWSAERAPVSGCYIANRLIIFRRTRSLDLRATRSNGQLYR